MRRESLERYPALAAAVVLHAGLFAAAILLGNLLNKPIYGPNVVSVTLINTANNPAPAIVTPTPTVIPAPPTPPTPEVAPAPTPLPPAPALKSAKTPPPSKTPAKPATAVPSDDSFFSHMSQTLAKGGAPAKPRPPSATASGTGAKPSPAAMASLKAQLERLWNPNCEVMGGSDVSIVLTFRLGVGGRLTDKPRASVGATNNDLTKVASDRAIRAVYQYFSDPSRPYADLPPENYTVNFNPKEYCSQR